MSFLDLALGDGLLLIILTHFSLPFFSIFLLDSLLMSFLFLFSHALKRDGLLRTAFFLTLRLGVFA